MPLSFPWFALYILHRLDAGAGFFYLLEPLYCGVALLAGKHFSFRLGLRPVGVCGDMPNIILDAAASVMPFKLHADFAGHCGKGVISGGEVLPVLYKLRCQALALCDQLSGAAVIVTDHVKVVADFGAFQVAPNPYFRFAAGAAVAGEQLVFIAHGNPFCPCDLRGGWCLVILNIVENYYNRAKALMDEYGNQENRDATFEELVEQYDICRAAGEYTGSA